jgi:hypothetical protein
VVGVDLALEGSFQSVLAFPALAIHGILVSILFVVGSLLE